MTIRKIRTTPSNAKYREGYDEIDWSKPPSVGPPILRTFNCLNCAGRWEADPDRYSFMIPAHQIVDGKLRAIDEPDCEGSGKVVCATNYDEKTGAPCTSP